jgi:tellurite resistance protein TehA-like permease
MLMFTVQELKMESMTAVWLLPLVPAVIIGGTGAVVAPTLPRQHALDTLLASYALLGMGLALSFLVMALYIQRLAVHHLPNAEVIC